MTVFQERFPKVKFELYSGSNEEIQERMEQERWISDLFYNPLDWRSMRLCPCRQKNGGVS